jgi:hypothetical protein
VSRYHGGFIHWCQLEMMRPMGRSLRIGVSKERDEDRAPEAQSGTAKISPTIMTEMLSAESGGY